VLEKSSQKLYKARVLAIDGDLFEPQKREAGHMETVD
jgi:hypothetical protein